MAFELVQNSPAGAGTATVPFRARRLLTQISNLLKLRIGVMMMLTALVAMLVTPGPAPTGFEVAVLCLGILLAAGAAGAFNQYYEVDLDRTMPRTCRRPFVTGYFERGPLWLGIIMMLLIAGLVLIGDVKTTWSFSAFTVLVYYALTNLAALRLAPEQRLYPRWLSVAGLASCVFVAFWVEPVIWLSGLGVLAAGFAWRIVWRRAAG